ncbi:hypothetical protein HPP92_028906 [Vanilla planifolia]|uniref:Uncharacterized protein n=1 Tax=Vanilla planifolia TaxID=51239 RepID=A0A835P5Y3_VANPL|nr:hypothetical protein HPP92_028906 [Vanilla planifolia]KAG0446309.1 hypothetical protein HPP92_028896 [Vanilla planifolia]
MSTFLVALLARFFCLSEEGRRHQIRRYFPPTSISVSLGCSWLVPTFPASTSGISAPPWLFPPRQLERHAIARLPKAVHDNDRDCGGRFVAGWDDLAPTRAGKMRHPKGEAPCCHLSSWDVINCDDTGSFTPKEHVKILACWSWGKINVLKA